jgi:hypothetical protein
MTFHGSGRYRPSNRHRKAVVIGSVTVGIVTVSSGMARPPCAPSTAS